MLYKNQVNLGQTAYWHPWKGCRKVSKACQNCFIKIFDRIEVGSLSAPMLPPNTIVITCLHSDFFIEDADQYRPQIWDEIKKHPELIFMLITKRIERVKECLPADWNDGYENVIISVTVETQDLIEKRLNIFHDIPCKHKWLSCCPLIEPLDLDKYLATGEYECVEACGEAIYPGEPRETKYEWVEALSSQCQKHNVRFSFMKLGMNFIKDNNKLSERSTCYHSPLADSLNLDVAIPLTFKLGNTEYTIL